MVDTNIKGLLAVTHTLLPGMTGEEIADIIVWLATQPEHINITALEVMPTDQAPNGLGFTAVEQGTV